MLSKSFRSVGCMMLIILGILCMPLAAVAQETVALSSFQAVDDPIGLQKGTQLTVGSPTSMSGHFGTEGWSLNTADMDVRSLLHGYATVSWTRGMGVAFNGAVVAGVETQQESGGGRNYVFTLHDDLLYSDGTKVTAKDYVFSLLLNGSQAFQSIGATPLNMDHVVGYTDYADGRTESIAGLRLLSDTSFSVRVSGEFLPFFYGLSMLNITPYPAAVIAPGYDVKDDGSGAYLAGSGGKLSADVLQKTLLDPVTGYEFSPKVTTGPYKLESYDSTAKRATFVVNDKFKGNFEGMKPHIERIVFRHVDNESMISLLESGEVDVLNKVSNPEAIDLGQALAETGAFQRVNYLRTGLAYLSYACEEGPTSSTAVRKAISMCLDIDELTARVGGVAARRVYGYYGYGQWMATYTTDNDGKGSALNMTEELDRLAINMNVDGAKALLEQDGWTLNESGGAYVAGGGAVRYRQTAAGLEPLIIRWAKTSPSMVADTIEEMLKPAMAEIGMQLEATPMSFDEMLPYLYRQEPRTFNMFYLATNFSHVFDPYYDFHVDDMYQGLINTSGLKDEGLMQLALAMRETNPTDMPGYAGKWLDFQKRFVELMPMTPLYSSVYFDFYTSKLQGYEIGAQVGWGPAVLYAHIAE